MNQSHYPSLELCKKLTEIGFPETEKIWSTMEQYRRPPEILESEDLISPLSTIYRCPSVMEMLDVMPNEVIVGDENEADSYDFQIIKNGENSYWVSYEIKSYHSDCIADCKGTLPNALAEMILWLHENNYISFNK